RLRDARHGIHQPGPAESADVARRAGHPRGVASLGRADQHGRDQLLDRVRPRGGRPPGEPSDPRRTHRAVAGAESELRRMTVTLDYAKLTKAAGAAETLASDMRSNAALARASSPLALPSLEGIEEKATAL